MALVPTRMDRGLITALTERWWDSTNSFHFLLIGEMTVTPLDFALLTGLRVGGSPIPYDSSIRGDHEDLLALLGVIPPQETSGLVRYDWFWEHFHSFEPVTMLGAEHLARAFLLYLFGKILFPNKENTVPLYFLGALRDLSRVRSFDWGGAALATLYGYMSVASRGRSTSSGGYWRVWDFWAYEYLGMGDLKSSLSDKLVIPRFLRWVSGNRKSRQGNYDLVTHRRFLNRLTFDQVNWHPWKDVGNNARTDLWNSRWANNRRILLEGPVCREWYLGERVVRQSLEHDHPSVPSPPPSSMRLADYLGDEILVEALRGYPAAGYVAPGSYTEFIRLYLSGAMSELEPPASERAGQRCSRLEKPRLPPRGLPSPPESIPFQDVSGAVFDLPLPPLLSSRLTLPPGVTQVPRTHMEAWLRHVERLYMMVRQRETSIRAMRPAAAPAMPSAPSSAFGDSGGDDGASFGASMSRASSRDTGPSSSARDSATTASSSRRRRRT